MIEEKTIFLLLNGWHHIGTTPYFALGREDGRRLMLQEGAFTYAFTLEEAIRYEMGELENSIQWI